MNKPENTQTEQDTAGTKPRDSKNNKQFFKKYGFFLGILSLLIIAAVVMIFDSNRTLKGDIPYDSIVYVIGDNSISMVKYNSEPVTISSAIFQSDEGQKIGVSAHNGIIMSKDEKSLIYLDQIRVVKAVQDGETKSKLVGDLHYFNGLSDTVISQYTDFNFLVSDDFTTVAYRDFYIDEDENRFVADLYLYDIETGQKHLVVSDIDTDNFTLSNDGKVCAYLDDHMLPTVEKGLHVYSLYKYENGIVTFVADNVYNLDASVVTGTSYDNYPLISKNGDNILYAVINYLYMVRDPETGKLQQLIDIEELEEVEQGIVYPTFNMYMHSDGNNTLIASSATQLLVSNDFSQIVVIENVIDHIDKFQDYGYCGTFSHYDVKTGVKTFIEDDVFGFTERNIMSFVDNEFINARFYLKRYDNGNNTAFLYTMVNGNKILIDREATVGSDRDKGIDFVFYSPDYKDVYVFKSYVEKSTILYKYTIKSNGKVSEYVCEDMHTVTGVKLSADGKYLVYNAEGRLVIINKDNVKKTIERDGASSFGITEKGRYVYYYKETSIGVGALYYYDTVHGKTSIKFLNSVNEVWNYKDDMVMFRNNTDYSTMTGDLYLTDFAQFEFMTSKVYSQITSKITERQ